MYINTNNEDKIYEDILSSLKFLNIYLKENEITFSEYFDLDRDILPIALKHIYAGTISVYFYACFPQLVLSKWFNYPDDVFQELFHLNKYEFLTEYILSKRDNILTLNKINNLISKLEQSFCKYF